MVPRIHSDKDNYDNYNIDEGIESIEAQKYTTKVATQKVLLSHTLPPYKNRNGNDNNNMFIHRFIGGCMIAVILGCLFWGPLIPFFVIGLLIKEHYYFVTVATILVLSSMCLSDHSPLFCRVLLRISGYFTEGVTVHIEKDAMKAINKEEGCMWCMHPHGTSIGFGFILNGALRCRTHDEKNYCNPTTCDLMDDKNRMRKADGVQAPILFKIPFVRSLLMGVGCSTPATKQDLIGLFQKRADFGMLPGGMEEVALYKKGHERIYIRNRMGFIKYALQHGYLLVPGYTFGESDLYNGINDTKNIIGRIIRKIQMYTLKNFGFVIPVFWGPYAKWGLPFLPRHDLPINTVIGSTLQLPKISNPTNDDVKKYHELYIHHITELFENYKEQFGYGDRQLEVI